MFMVWLQSLWSWSDSEIPLFPVTAHTISPSSTFGLLMFLLEFHGSLDPLEMGLTNGHLSIVNILNQVHLFSTCLQHWLLSFLTIFYRPPRMPIISTKVLPLFTLCFVCCLFYCRDFINSFPFRGFGTCAGHQLLCFKMKMWHHLNQQTSVLQAKSHEFLNVRATF